MNDSAAVPPGGNPPLSPPGSHEASRPTSAISAVQVSSRPGSGKSEESHVRADKLARIGVMLRKQGEPDALAHLQRSLHMYPGGVGVWKTLGHALAQDEMPLPASAAFGAACALTQASGGDVAAQTGLATMLTQLGRPAAATDELIRIRKSAKANDAGVSVMAEPLERLCRRLMPGHRFTAVQSNARIFVKR